MLTLNPSWMDRLKPQLSSQPACLSLTKQSTHAVIWLFGLLNLALSPLEYNPFLLEIQLKELLQSPNTSQINHISCLLSLSPGLCRFGTDGTEEYSFCRTGRWKTIIFYHMKTIVLSSLGSFIMIANPGCLLDTFLKPLSFPKRFLFNRSGVGSKYQYL